MVKRRPRPTHFDERAFGSFMMARWLLRVVKMGTSLMLTLALNFMPGSRLMSVTPRMVPLAPFPNLSLTSFWNLWFQFPRF